MRLIIGRPLNDAQRAWVKLPPSWYNAAAHGLRDGGQWPALKKPMRTKKIAVIEEVTWESFRLSELGAIPPAASCKKKGGSAVKHLEQNGKPDSVTGENLNIPRFTSLLRVFNAAGIGTVGAHPIAAWRKKAKANQGSNPWRSE